MPYIAAVIIFSYIGWWGRGGNDLSPSYISNSLGYGYVNFKDMIIMMMTTMAAVLNNGRLFHMYN